MNRHVTVFLVFFGALLFGARVAFACTTGVTECFTASIGLWYEDDTTNAYTMLVNTEAGDAIFGQSLSNGTGIGAYSQSGIGVWTSADNGAFPPEDNAYGLFSSSGSADAVHAITSGSGMSGVYGEAGTGNGVYGAASTGIGVYALGEGGSTSATGPYGMFSSCGSGDSVHSTYVGTGGDSAVYGASTQSGATGNGGYFTTNNTTGAGAAGISFANGDNAAGIWGQIYTAGAGSAIWGTNESTAAYAYAGNFSGAVNATGEYQHNGACFEGCSSDERLKQNILPLSDALDTLLELRGVHFEWRDPDSGRSREPGQQTGLIAQEVQRIFPQWVGEDIDGYKTLTIDHRAMAALTVEAVRRLKMESDARKVENTGLIAENIALRARVAKLEADEAKVSSLEERLAALEMAVAAR
jgi:hypothetical protein